MIKQRKLLLILNWVWNLFLNFNWVVLQHTYQGTILIALIFN